MFDFKLLINKLVDYGFCRAAEESNIEIKRLVSIIDGLEFFNSEEIEALSLVLKIPPHFQDDIFFKQKLTQSNSNEKG